MTTTITATALLLLVITGCSSFATSRESRTFGEDVEFLRAHTDVIVLGKGTSAEVVVAPKWQGRVMTSTARGDSGAGYGWINDAWVEAGNVEPHINIPGGEDRFWMGPEGGQYAIFFPKGASFDLDHWQTPPCIDTEAYEVVERDDSHVTFRHRASVVNYAGSRFDVEIRRTVRQIESNNKQYVPTTGPDVKCVAYQTENSITNVGTNAWTKDSGLLSIWILGMFKPSPDATVIVPFVEGSEAERGRIVNDAYFGKVPEDRLRIDRGVLYFKGDGQHRSKIGLGPRRAKSVAGSFDASRNVLTVVVYSKPDGASDYVNSMWELQREPYGGDVVNSYNDGPLGPGKKPLGPFYEIETSSPAAALKPGQSLEHVHTTMHFEGPRAQLDAISRDLLGVTLDRK
ncbi:MAG: hypothetical protein HYR85_13975 [Planctomycetes bacterium]|nr:hypothetical protein [Planctomycetota bacterium]MBI3846957.1 hypothetical protein [Planctomycetota bacterium]